MAQAWKWAMPALNSTLSPLWGACCEIHPNWNFLRLYTPNASFSFVLWPGLSTCQLTSLNGHEGALVTSTSTVILTVSSGAWANGLTSYTSVFFQTAAVPPSLGNAQRAWICWPQLQQLQTPFHLGTQTLTPPPALTEPPESLVPTPFIQTLSTHPLLTPPHVPPSGQASSLRPALPLLPLSMTKVQGRPSSPRSPSSSSPSSYCPSVFSITTSSAWQPTPSLSPPPSHTLSFSLPFSCRKPGSWSHCNTAAMAKIKVSGLPGIPPLRIPILEDVGKVCLFCMYG